LEADDSGTHFTLNDDDASYGDPVASSTGMMPPVSCWNCCTSES